MTSKLTRKELLNIIETDHVQCGEASYLARMALAALDSEPVGEFYEDGPLNWYQISDGDRVPDHRRIPLYRHAQPAPVAPAMASVGEMPFLGESEGVYVRGWNDCRAAMLNHSEGNLDMVNHFPDAGNMGEPVSAAYTLGNSPVIPDGYVLVPREPTAEMYEAGDQQLATKQVWDAMIAAAPQEVTSASPIKK